MPDSWLGFVFAIAVALAGGAGSAEGIRAFREWRAGIAGRHKRELQDLGAQLAAAVAERDRALDEARTARRRERIATEHAHEVRLLALGAGVPSSAMPVLDYQDD